MTTDKKKKDVPVVAWIYAGCVLMLSIVMLYRFNGQVDKKTFSYKDEVQVINQFWKTASGDNISFLNLQQYDKEDEPYISVFYDLPERIRPAQIEFQSKNCYVEVYQNGELIYQTNRKNETNSLYTRTVFWNRFEVINQGENSQLEMRIFREIEKKNEIVKNALKNDAFVEYQKILEDHNECGKYPYAIKIAHGLAYLPEISYEGFEQAENVADEVMYREKNR